MVRAASGACAGSSRRRGASGTSSGSTWRTPPAPTRRSPSTAASAPTSTTSAPSSRPTCAAPSRTPAPSSAVRPSTSGSARGSTGSRRRSPGRPTTRSTATTSSLSRLSCAGGRGSGARPTTSLSPRRRSTWAGASASPRSGSSARCSSACGRTCATGSPRAGSASGSTCRTGRLGTPIPCAASGRTRGSPATSWRPSSGRRSLPDREPPRQDVVEPRRRADLPHRRPEVVGDPVPSHGIAVERGEARAGVPVPGLADGADVHEALLPRGESHAHAVGAVHRLEAEVGPVDPGVVRVADEADPLERGEDRLHLLGVVDAVRGEDVLPQGVARRGVDEEEPVPPHGGGERLEVPPPLPLLRGGEEAGAHLAPGDLDRAARVGIEVGRLPEEGLVVVPHQGDGGLLADEVDDRLGVRAVPDDVPEADDLLHLRQARDRLEDRLEGLAVAVEVGDEGDQPRLPARQRSSASSASASTAGTSAAKGPGRSKPAALRCPPPPKRRAKAFTSKSPLERSEPLTRPPSISRR